MKRKQRKISAPSLVVSHIDSWNHQGLELLTVDAFKRGAATDTQMGMLEDMANLICIANKHDVRNANLKLESELCALFKSIRLRNNGSDTFALNAKEREIMPILACMYREYWKRGTAQRYNNCLVILDVFLKNRKSFEFYNGMKIER